MFIVTGAPTGVVARGQRDGRSVVLIPDQFDGTICDLAALVLDQQELAELQRHLSARLAPTDPDQPRRVDRPGRPSVGPVAVPDAS